MSNVSQLPPWVFYLQALAVPIFAALGVWIAARQMLIANDKLRLDSFDRQYERRIALYEATRGILEQVFRETLTEADTRTYGLRALTRNFSSILRCTNIYAMFIITSRRYGMPEARLRATFQTLSAENMTR